MELGRQGRIIYENENDGENGEIFCCFRIDLGEPLPAFGSIYQIYHGHHAMCNNPVIKVAKKVHKELVYNDFGYLMTFMSTGLFQRCVISCEENEEIMCFVLEKYEINLAEVLGSSARHILLRKYDRVEIIRGLCQAVRCLHSKGIVHRDIRPRHIGIVLRDGKNLILIAAKALRTSICLFLR